MKMQALPEEDLGAKVSNDTGLVYLMVVLFMTLATMATTLGIYHVKREL